MATLIEPPSAACLLASEVQGRAGPARQTAEGHLAAHRITIDGAGEIKLKHAKGQHQLADKRNVIAGPCDLDRFIIEQ